MDCGGDQVRMRMQLKLATDPRACDLEAGSGAFGRSHRPLPGKYAAAARASRMQTNSMVAVIKVLPLARQQVVTDDALWHEGGMFTLPRLDRLRGNV